MNFKFAVIGSSIAGSACANVLSKLGFEVTIFEKSAINSFSDRGAGIWLPYELVNKLMHQEIIAKNVIGLEINERPIIHYNFLTNNEHLIASHPIKGYALHWQQVYNALKNRKLEDKINYDAELTKVVNLDRDKVGIVINNQQSYEFDFCIFCDGINSFGRKYLYPEYRANFVNTIIWRGTLEINNSRMVEKFLGKAPFYVFERGHLLIYLVPNLSDNSQQYKYIINWLIYEKVDLNHKLFKHDTDMARQNIIKGHMPELYLDYLHTNVRKWFSKDISDLIINTQAPYTQAVNELLIPSYIKDNLLLVGDSSNIVRPHTAAGATKALSDALALETQITQNKNIDLAFRNWNNRQYSSGRNLYYLGQELGRLFVTDSPNWQNTTKQEIDKLWYEKSINCWYAKID